MQKMQSNLRTSQPHASQM